MNTEQQPLTVYVVIEDDRGCGPTLVGVFRTLEAAEEACYGSHMWIETVQVR